MIIQQNTNDDSSNGSDNPTCLNCNLHNHKPPIANVIALLASIFLFGYFFGFIVFHFSQRRESGARVTASPAFLGSASFHPPHCRQGLPSSGRQ